MDKLLYEILRQYGAMTWLELQERYNQRRGTPPYPESYASRHHIINTLTDGAKHGYFEYSQRVDRWFCGNTNPNL